MLLELDIKFAPATHNVSISVLRSFSINQVSLQTTKVSAYGFHHQLTNLWFLVAGNSLGSNSNIASHKVKTDSLVLGFVDPEW